MPGGDRTGPAGAGPMTGRGLGYCAGYDAPGFVRAGFAPPRALGGRQWGGGGRGWRWCYYATGLPGWARFGYARPVPPSAEEQKQVLESRAKWLEEELAAIRRRIDDLETS